MLAISATLATLLASSFALPQASYSAPPSVQTVIVGGANGELTYTPEAVFANIGDQVVFQFHQKNHSAVQSSFANPCGRKDGGFDSGYFPVDASATDNFPTYTITVNDTQPIWVYCSQGAGAHCHAGMVFAVNCPATGANTFDNFKASAIAQGANSSSAYAPPTATSSDDTAAPDTTSYPGITVPAAPQGDLVTSTVELQGSTWTTTYTSYPNSPDPTPNSLTGNVITVLVGDNGTLTFDPPRVSAQPRDIINFQFMTKNHTVTQSSFADPCRKLSLTSPGTDSVDSGFMPVAAGGPTPEFNVTVNDTAPLWFYCRQTGHCGMGMVFAVNSDETSARSFSAFQTLAKEINGTSSNATTAGSGSGSTSLGTGSASGRYTVNVALAVVSVALGALLL